MRDKITQEYKKYFFVVVYQMMDDERLAAALDAASLAVKQLKQQKHFELSERIMSHMSSAARLHRAAKYDSGPAGLLRGSAQHLGEIDKLLALSQRLSLSRVNRSTGKNANTMPIVQVVSVNNVASNQTKNAAKTIENAAALPNTLAPHDFDDLSGVRKEIKDVIRKVYKFKSMTQTQYECIPIVLEGCDAFIKASTGTGKTLAFLIPIIEMIMRTQTVAARDFDLVILFPTQTLAIQAFTLALPILTPLGLTIGKAIGGDATKSHHLVSVGANVLFATPLRLIQFLEDPLFKAKFSRGVKFFVLDEGDVMISGSFLPAVRTIAASMPTKHQTVLISATMDEKTLQTAATLFLPGFKHVEVITPIKTKHEFAKVLPEKVFAALLTAIDDERSSNLKDHRVVVFFPSKRLVDLAYELLKIYFGIKGLSSYMSNVLVIHGDVSESQRESRLWVYKKKKPGVNIGDDPVDIYDPNGKIVLASDMLARGIDYPDVTLVVQFGASSTAQDYMQRTGRTGRAEKDGAALSILGDDKEGNGEFFKKVSVELSNIGKTFTDVSARVGRDSSVVDGVVKVIKDDPRLQKLVLRAWNSTSGSYKAYRIFKTDDELFDAMKARFGALGVPENMMPNRADMAERNRGGKRR